MDKNEILVAIVFFFTGVLWISSGFLPEAISNHLTDTIRGILDGTSLFVIQSTKEKGKLLEWDDMKDLPWWLLVLFGGGMSLAAAFYDFFFSSRRRHTRSKRDWSSDVCSSD